MATEPTTQGHPDTESDSARPSTRVVLSEDLPLTLFIAAVTTVVLSVINTVPELLWIGVLVAPVLADALKHWISEREGWGKRRLLRLTGILAAGGTAERIVRRREASDAAAATAPATPSASAILTTALLSSAITIGTLTALEEVRDRALLVDRPTTFLSAKLAADDKPTVASRAGFATPGAAITATARNERWAEQSGLTFTGRCPEGFTGGQLRGRVMCWFPDPDPPPPARAQLKSGERLFTVGGHSFHEEIWLALERSAGRWRVTQIIPPPELPEDTGPVTQP